MKKVKYASLFNYICAGLVVLLLVTQFLPFWTADKCAKCPDGTTSISDYVWFPDDHQDITKMMKGKDLYGKDFAVGDIVLTPVIIVAATILTLYFCLRYAYKPMMGIFPFLGGLGGVFGYLTQPGLQIGQLWFVHLALAALVMICGGVAISQLIVNFVRRKKAEASK